MLDIASKNRNIANVFFLQASNIELLQRDYMKIATRVGHEILSSRHLNQNLYSIWRDYTPEQKVEAFKTWLGDPENEDALFIVDDLDGLMDEETIRAAL